MQWSLVTCTISSGSLSEEVLVSDRRQLPMSLDTEDTLCMMLMTTMTMMMELTINNDDHDDITNHDDDNDQKHLKLKD